MTRKHYFIFAALLFVIVGILSLYARSLMANYGSGLADEMLHNGSLRKTIDRVVFWRYATAIAGVAILISAIFDFKPSKKK